MPDWPWLHSKLLQALLFSVMCPFSWPNAFLPVDRRQGKLSVPILTFTKRLFHA